MELNAKPPKYPIFHIPNWDNYVVKEIKDLLDFQYFSIESLL